MRLARPIGDTGKRARILWVVAGLLAGGGLWWLLAKNTPQGRRQ